MPLPSVDEFIGPDVTQQGFKDAQKNMLEYISDELPTKTDLETEVSAVELKIQPKADKTYVDTALASFQNGAIKTYPTLSAANADIANIALNTKVSVLSETDGGDYYKATANATSLTKSPYDPVKVAQKYTDLEIENLSIEKDPSRSEGYYLIQDPTGKYVLLITADGTLKAKLNIKKAAVSNGLHVNVDSNGLLTEIGLGTKEGVLPVGDCEMDGSRNGSFGSSVFAIQDSTGRSALILEKDGLLKAKFNIIADGAKNGLKILQDPSTLQLKVSLGDAEGIMPLGENKQDGTKVGAYGGYLYTICDKSGRIAFGILSSGKVVGNFDLSGLDVGIPNRYMLQQAESQNYLVQTYLDNSKQSQLKLFDKTSAKIIYLTTAGNNLNPQISFDEKSVLFTLEKEGSSSYVHTLINGSGEIFPVNALSRVIGWGDSMTAPGSGYFDVLMSQPDMSKLSGINQGIGGQRALSIVQRAGAAIQNCIIENNTIPASGSVNITNAINAFYNQTLAARAEIAGVKGVFKNLYDSTNNKNITTFTVDADYTGGAVNVTNPVEVKFIGTYFNASLATGGTLFKETRNFIHSIRIGRNDVGKADYNQTDTIMLIDSLVKKIQTFNKQFYVMGVTSAYSDLPTSMGGTKTEAASIEIMNQIKNLNLALAEKYGSNYIDIQTAMIDAGYGQTVTINGNTYTVLNNTWSSDGVHESSVGKLATANHIINNVFKAKGWI